MSGWLAHCALAKGTQSTQWEIKQIPSVWWKQLNHLHILTFLRFDPFSRILPGFKNFWCLPVIHLPLASLFYPSLSSHYILNYSFNTSLFHFGCSSSPASSPLPAPPPQDQERAQKAQEAQPQRGRPPRQRGRPGSQPRPLLNQKKTSSPPPFFSSAASCSLPVSLSSPFPQTVLHNNSPKLSDQAASLRPCPALHCPALSSPSQPVS